jgi:hypothetical protein
MTSRIQRRLVAASADIRTEMPDELTFMHSALCQCVLPARKPAESGKSLGLRGGSEEWAMQTAIEDGRADLEQAMGAAR